MSFTHTQKGHTGIAMIDLHEVSTKISKIAQLRKAEICAEDNGISDMQSFVVFHNGDRFECRQSGLDGHPFESLPLVLNDAYNDGLTKFDSISLVVDSFYRDRINDPNYQKGDLQKDFSNNPMSTVVECLTTVTYGYDGHSVGTVVKYVYNDKGLPEFTLVTDKDHSEMKSEFVDFVMTKYIEFCKKGKEQ